MTLFRMENFKLISPRDGCIAGRFTKKEDTNWAQMEKSPIPSINHPKTHSRHEEYYE